MCGEEEVNEWTQQYVGERPSKARQLQGRQNPFKQIRRLVDPTVVRIFSWQGCLASLSNFLQQPRLTSLQLG